LFGPAIGTAAAQTAPDPDPTTLANVPNDDAPPDWQFRLGAGIGVSPAYLGSKTYQVAAAPFAEVRYKDRYFVSVFDGAGADVIKTRHFRAGPTLSFDSGRKESGKTFKIAGNRDTSLIGLGDVKSAVQAGGFAEYSLGAFTAKAQVSKALGGTNGLVANLGVRLTEPIRISALSNKPIIVSVGPRMTFVDSKHNNAYFGVDANQSLNSGLPQYTAKGGLQSYGVGATVLVPVSKSVSAIMLFGYDRLSGDAADSPLVRERGSANQATAGLGLIYHFGL
jgi:outer membrane protein